MDTFLNMAVGIVAGIIGGLTAGGIVLLLILRSPPRACPECGTVLPKFRTPASLGQFLRGGWTCPACAAELNSRAQKIAA